MTAPDWYVSECNAFEKCRACRCGTAHPPLLAVYDADERDYAYADGGVCVARWASTNADHRAGSLCGRPASRRAGDVDLCDHHYERMIDWREYDQPLEVINGKIAALQEARRTYAAELEQTLIHRERIDAASSLVYYIRRTSDGMIKIGTTRSFQRRVNQIRAEFGELQILLTHGGTAKKELEMHRKFEAYRIRRTEWFRPMKPLLRWIYEGRGAYGLTQQQGAIRRAEIRKLMVAAPPDPKWRGGKLCVPMVTR